MEHQPFRAGLFDLGGTLVDTQAALLAAMRATIHELGLACPAEASLRANLGWSEPRLLHGLIPPELEEQALAPFLERMRLDLGHARPIPGAKAALERLRGAGIRCALVSGFSRATLHSILAPLGWEPLFDTLVSDDDVERPRPYPDMLLTAAHHLGLGVESCFAVGDSLYDLKSAAACAMDFFGVLTGAQARELAAELPKGRALASVAELPGLVLL